jgi:hypothetical protein
MLSREIDATWFQKSEDYVNIFQRGFGGAVKTGLHVLCTCAGQAVAFLDQLNVVNPLAQPYSEIQLLASQIKSLAPKNLPVKPKCLIRRIKRLGLVALGPSHAEDPNRTFMGYSFAAKVIGFVIEA